MARQRKTLPARRQQATDDSLLIRSAESLGRMIGSLQRQLDAARRLTLPSVDGASGNGHAPGRKGTKNPKPKTKHAAKKTAAVKSKPARRVSATKRRTEKSAT